MNENNANKLEQLEFDEEDKKIYDAFIELGWLIPQTEEEVERAEKGLGKIKCPSLPSELTDPSKILERIKNRKNNAEDIKNNPIQPNKMLELSPTLLSLLWQATKISQNHIAQKLEVTIAFMRGCSDFSDSVPEQCKQELINRAVKKFSFIDKILIEKIVRHPKQIATAGFRDTSYSGKKMSFEEIVEKSGMDKIYQKFWLDLAKGEQQ